MNEQNNLKDIKDSPNMAIPGAIIVAGIIIAAAVLFTRPTTPQENPDTHSDVLAAQYERNVELAENMTPVTLDDHLRGSPEADLVLVEYSDIECPFCADLHLTLKELMADYGKRGELAWVYRHYPIVDLHPTARLQAIASECVASLAGKEAFWSYLDVAFATQTQSTIDLQAYADSVTESGGTLSNDLLIAELRRQIKPMLAGMATSFGISESSFNTCLSDPKYAAIVDAEFNNGLEAGVAGTPHNIIVTKSGKKFPINNGNPDLIKATIELALKEEK